MAKPKKQTANDAAEKAFAKWNKGAVPMSKSSWLEFGQGFKAGVAWARRQGRKAK